MLCAVRNLSDCAEVLVCQTDNVGIVQYLFFVLSVALSARRKDPWGQKAAGGNFAG